MKRRYKKASKRTVKKTTACPKWPALPVLWLPVLGCFFLRNMGQQLNLKDIASYAVTKLVRESFSRQLGDWCRAHGVEYIGHIIEDNNAHARTGVSLGHYFRGLDGQDMAGIDDIGGQVLPQGEDGPDTGALGMARDGEFYHYMLGNLAASAAAIQPEKRGRAMCEIFGNYGWAEGVRLEKYLADHFLVRGINYSELLSPLADCPVVTLDGLVPALRGLNLPEAVFAPASTYLRAMHYQGECGLFCFVNEGAKPYAGTVTVPYSGPCCWYDP